MANKQIKTKICTGHACQAKTGCRSSGRSIHQGVASRVPQIEGQKIEPSEIPPAICFSRKIGGGALEIADLLAEKINYRVVDRELLEHIAQDKDLSSKNR